MDLLECQSAAKVDARAGALAVGHAHAHPEGRHREPYRGPGALIPFLVAELLTDPRRICRDIDEWLIRWHLARQKEHA